jgi:hypothetical protein
LGLSSVPGLQFHSVCITKCKGKEGYSNLKDRENITAAKSKKDTLAPLVRHHLEWGGLESVITEYIQIIYKLQRWQE